MEEEVKDFEYINSTYWKMFSFSNLNVFLDREPTGNVFIWKLKRFLNYFFIFIYFPSFFTIEILGMLFGREGNLPQIAFDISYVAHLIQVFIKTNYYIYHIEEMRALCQKFETFNSSRHRPVLARRILGKKAEFLRKLAKRYYTTIYMNFIFWSVSPLIIQPVMYILNQSGVIPGEMTLIPKFFPVRYPFSESKTENRIVIAFMEFVVLTAGFIYFIPIDQFFVSVIVMVCGQMDVICTSIQSKEELAKEIGKSYRLGPHDETDRIHMKYFIQDHQRGIQVTKKIADIINPILAVNFANCMACLCTLAIFITKKAKTTESFVEFAREVGGFCIVMTTSVISLYLYSWMCGELKKCEEEVFLAAYSSNWYEQDKKYRSSILIVMGQSLKARALRTLGIGDIDRETFIQGLRAIYSYYNFLANFE